MLRTIYERMNLRESESITPQDLINSRVVTTVINTFFGTSQLSQFGIRQTHLPKLHINDVFLPWSRRLTRERAGFEVRMFIILIMADYVQLKHLKGLILD
ncbi:MAG: hypothetical protein CM1200mP10_31950 [Candidatus Neomarinimicrobiota bacterium]|nr:MAG: hypothetical protein CM1200mP10_31950 [Candidatus Neomarinimicrobiota bacterium]